MGGRVSHSLVQALRTVPDFADLDETSLLQVVGASTNLVWSEGSLIFQQGDMAEALYVILSGRVQIFEPVGEGEKEVASLGPGDYLGEISLLLHTNHSKSARALEETELMVVPEESFEDLLATNPTLAADFRERLTARLLANQNAADT